MTKFDWAWTHIFFVLGSLLIHCDIIYSLLLWIIIIIVHKWWNYFAVDIFLVKPKNKTTTTTKNLLECIKCFKYEKLTKRCAITIKSHFCLFEINFSDALIILQSIRFCAASWTATNSISSNINTFACTFDLIGFFSWLIFSYSLSTSNLWMLDVFCPFRSRWICTSNCCCCLFNDIASGAIQ